jgi:hypothetical protein
MGTVSGIMVAGFINAFLFTFLPARGLLAGPLFVLFALAVFFGCVWLLGRIGYRLGKRFYRAYQQPVHPVWGEDDEAPAGGPTGDSSTLALEGEGGKPTMT